jgi:hypothetical protein
VCCAVLCRRQALKEYSNWPTYPQLYVAGELIGGCDIVLEMQASGELAQLVKEKAAAALQPPKQQVNLAQKKRVGCTKGGGAGGGQWV